ncbi:FAD-binding oxidoreductase [Kitasatospora sp. NPDC098652]|uniref:FAD-binding oxidoreductase n=1 Tax=Kitasatospora sp. NPDC098652 TaxID=3364095 RepID=UPI00381A33D1
MPTRRTLLKGGALALAAAGLGSMGAGPASLAEASDWSRLGSRLKGRLVRPQDPDYAFAKQLNFMAFDAVNPAGIAYCADADDVRTCLSFAHHHGIPAVPRSGGHSYGGYSTTTGLIIDVSKLNGIRFGPQTAVVGPGAQLVDVVDAASANGVALAGGICPTVAMGGYLQGGGVGWQTRALGLGADSVVSAEVVLADGKVVTASEEEHPELFWALRGGGGGNFGIVTRYERRHTTIPRMVNYTLAWPWDSAEKVLDGWQHWLADSAPREIGARCLLGLLDASPGAAPFLLTDGTFIGSPEELTPHLNALAAAIGQTPPYRNVQELGYRGGMMSWFKCSTSSVAQCHRVGDNPQANLPRSGFSLSRSRLFRENMPATGSAEVLAAFEADRRAGHARMVHVFALGGASSDIGRTATAYVHRDIRFSVDWATVLPADKATDEEQAAARAWIDNGFAVTDRYSAHETYQNYIDPALPDWRESYYAENYPRLVEAKNAYDPHGFFSFEQSIGR